MPQTYSNFQVQRNKVVGQSLERIATWLVMLAADLVKIIVDVLSFVIKMIMGKH